MLEDNQSREEACLSQRSYLSTRGEDKKKMIWLMVRSTILASEYMDDAKIAEVHEGEEKESQNMKILQRKDLSEGWKVKMQHLSNLKISAERIQR